MHSSNPESDRAAAAQYLVDYLCEEFSRQPQIRIRSVRLENEPGISVKTEAREYFFPLDWAWRRDFTAVQGLVRQIREGLRD
jgi:hypothetical protein